MVREIYEGIRIKYQEISSNYEEYPAKLLIIIFIINRVFNNIFIILITSIEMAQTTGPIPSSIIGTGKRICFAAEVDSEVPRQLHRAPTPYPKELRNLARHARNLHHQSTHDTQRVSYLSFVVYDSITIFF